MALDQIGQPFQGTIHYWVEDSYGSGESAATLPVSCKVQDVRIGTGDRFISLRDIGSALPCHLLKQTHEPTLHLEYHPQCDDTLIDDVVDRIVTTEKLQSLAFCVGTNVRMSADADDVTYLYIVGCKPETVRISASRNQPYLITVDFMAKSVATQNAIVGEAPAALTGDYLQFNVAGEITKSGGQYLVDVDHLAFIVDSIDVTISHQLTGYTDHDSLYKSYITEGEMSLEGSVDITLDGGGKYHLGEVLANSEFSIQVDMGGSGCPRITLANCQWNSSEIDVNVSGEAMMESAPFTAKPSSPTNIITSVP